MQDDSNFEQWWAISTPSKPSRCMVWPARHAISQCGHQESPAGTWCVRRQAAEVVS